MGNFLALFSSDFGHRPADGVPPEQAVENTDAAPLSRAEQDAWFLSGKFWEPEPAEADRNDFTITSERR